MTPADFAADVRALATCKRSEELEQRVARLAVRMETCRQETCAPIDVDLEGEITRAILALQGDALDVAPYRRTAAMVCARVRAALAMTRDGVAQLEDVIANTRPDDLAAARERIEQLRADLAVATVEPAKQATELALALGFPDAVPPWPMLLALLRARLGGGA